MENSEFPGVYLLAYTEKNLEDTAVNIKDVFYVGMSNSKGGVFQRLNQFIKGIEKCDLHSAAVRFFREYANNTPFSRTGINKKFYVIFLSIPCKVNKEERSAEDLRKMGEVAKFEYDVLAYIKEKLGKEPELNKK